MSLFDELNKKFGDKGLGDTVARTIDKVSGGYVKPCGGCSKRKKVLNDMFPYKDSELK